MAGFRGKQTGKAWMSDTSKGLRLYNTLTRTKQDFVPIDARNVRMYVCGPTVYDDAHLGHSRNYVTTDVIRRIMMHYFGFKVSHLRPG